MMHIIFEIKLQSFHVNYLFINRVNGELESCSINQTNRLMLKMKSGAIWTLIGLRFICSDNH